MDQSNRPWFYFSCRSSWSINNMGGKVDGNSSDYLAELPAKTDRELRYSIKQPTGIGQNLPLLPSVFLVRNPSFTLNIVPFLVHSVSVRG